MQQVGNKNQTAPYRRDVESVLTEFRSNRDGLSSSEATQRLEASGSNTLESIKTDPAWLKYARQYKDLMIVLLLSSAALSLYLGDKRTAIVLSLIVIFNTTIGFAQEFKAEKIMQALEKLVKPVAEVYRDGKLGQIDSSLLVPGDIVRISEGDSVPADLRLLEEMELSTNDFALTGESNPSRKFTHAIEADVTIGGRQNIAFMGTTVATGEAIGVVVGTGMNSELGRIANLSQSAPREFSPLQRELNNIASHVTIAVGVMCLASSLYGYLLAPLALWQRLALAAGAILLIKPGIVTDTIGLAVLLLVGAMQWAAARRSVPGGA